MEVARRNRFRSELQKHLVARIAVPLAVLTFLVGCGGSDTDIPESNHPQNHGDGLESQYPQDESDGFQSGGGLMPTYVPTHDGYETDQPTG